MKPWIRWSLIAVALLGIWAEIGDMWVSILLAASGVPLGLYLMRRHDKQTAFASQEQSE